MSFSFMTETLSSQHMPPGFAGTLSCAKHPKLKAIRRTCPPRVRRSETFYDCTSVFLAAPKGPKTKVQSSHTSSVSSFVFSHFLPPQTRKGQRTQERPRAGRRPRPCASATCCHAGGLPPGGQRRARHFQCASRSHGSEGNRWVT